jgi:hypothetical protein
MVSVTDAVVAPGSTKTPTMMRSPTVTLPGKTWLNVWPAMMYGEADMLCTKVIGRAGATRLRVAVWELLPTLAVRVAF